MSQKKLEAPSKFIATLRGAARDPMGLVTLSMEHKGVGDKSRAVFTIEAQNRTGSLKTQTTIPILGHEVYDLRDLIAMVDLIARPKTHNITHSVPGKRLGAAPISVHYSVTLGSIFFLGSSGDQKKQNHPDLAIRNLANVRSREVQVFATAEEFAKFKTELIQMWEGLLRWDKEAYKGWLASTKKSG